MKRNLLSAMFALLIGFSALALAEDKPKKDDPKAPINKFCAVEGEDHPVDPKVTYEYKGKLIGFCCADCIDTFKKDPDKYMKKLK